MTTSGSLYPRSLGVFLAVFLLARVATADEPSEHSYPIPEHGTFRIQVPPGWHEELRQPSGTFPPTIVLTPGTSGAFQVLITPLFSMNPDVIMPRPEELHAIVERAAEDAKLQSVERSLPIHELKGPFVFGYYFSATDRAPLPQEYKYMTQGMFAVGELVPTFTILTNDGAGDVVSRSLDMLRNAVHAP